MLYDPKWEIEPATEPQIEPWRRLLLEAAEIIRVRGWCRYAFTNISGQVCAMGAIRVATHGMTYPVMHYSLYNRYTFKDYEAALLRLIMHFGGCIIPYWNDALAKDAEEVIATITKVARS